MLITNKITLINLVLSSSTPIGVYIDYYNGDMIDHITRYEARVYFVCDKSTTINGPVFEHLKDDYKAHFHVFTKYVC